MFAYFLVWMCIWLCDSSPLCVVINMPLSLFTCCQSLWQHKSWLLLILSSSETESWKRKWEWNLKLAAVLKIVNEHTLKLTVMLNMLYIATRQLCHRVLMVKVMGQGDRSSVWLRLRASPACKPSDNESSGARWHPCLWTANTDIFIAEGLGAFMHDILYCTCSQYLHIMEMGMSRNLHR